jgi:Zn-finger nucleic acid-binding protein
MDAARSNFRAERARGVFAVEWRDVCQSIGRLPPRRHLARVGSIVMPYRDTKTPCPRCGGVLDGAWSDREARLECSICHGLFVGFVSLNRSHASLVARLAQRPSVVPQGPLGCPLCGEPMRAHIADVRQEEITVDYCSRHGAWFDRGEIEALAKAVTPA